MGKKLKLLKISYDFLHISVTKKNCDNFFSYIVPEDMLLIFLVNHMFILARLYFKNGYAKKNLKFLTKNKSFS